jgi:hypothetical protein
MVPTGERSDIFSMDSLVRTTTAPGTTLDSDENDDDFEEDEDSPGGPE